MDNPDLLAEQIAYYRARAPEYERGLYATAEAHALMGEVVERIPSDVDVLEIACGTGVWTEHLATRARTLTALDAAPEMIEIARPHSTRRRAVHRGRHPDLAAATSRRGRLLRILALPRPG
jgi:demethylmenaquinone methyltransferase/2-methoxy-6-polyprenyl-1,4-benzoquinol methylase